MFPQLMLGKADNESSKFCKFQITVYCERTHLEFARQKTTDLAANVDGVIMARSSERVSLLNGDELDEIDEITG
jgi:hypothetical protein